MTDRCHTCLDLLLHVVRLLNFAPYSPDDRPDRSLSRSHVQIDSGSSHLAWVAREALVQGLRTSVRLWAPRRPTALAIRGQGQILLARSRACLYTESPTLPAPSSTPKRQPNRQSPPFLFATAPAARTQLLDVVPYERRRDQRGRRWQCPAQRRQRECAFASPRSGSTHIMHFSFGRCQAARSPRFAGKPRGWLPPRPSLVLGVRETSLR